jgi:hypothetical protein
MREIIVVLNGTAVILTASEGECCMNGLEGGGLVVTLRVITVDGVDMKRWTTPCQQIVHEHLPCISHSVYQFLEVQTCLPTLLLVMVLMMIEKSPGGDLAIHGHHSSRDQVRS